MNKDKSEVIFRTTLRSAVLNVLLTIFKYVAGFLGHSAAMIADATHSLSDLITDIIVLVFSKSKVREKDERYDYGRGRIENLITIIVGFVILAIGISVCYHGIAKIVRYAQGEVIEKPGYIALIAAIISMVVKEWAFRFTFRTAQKTKTIAVTSNAWQHRSDAFSSFVTAICIGCAIFFSEKLRILDLVAVLLVGLFIAREAIHLIVDASNILLDKSLPNETEELITKITMEEEGVNGVRDVLTRQIGRDLAVEVYITISGNDTVRQAHERMLSIEKRLQEQFGEDTYVNVHFEPAEDEEL
ncbi:MAG: cation transporter [Prevotella sp.]|nr:cation transporter [Prevotella sp.]